jgi:hypothetical protein
MFQDGFPIFLRDEVSKVVKLIPVKTYSNIITDVSEQKNRYFLNGDVIEFPDRIYYVNIPDEALDKLSLQQKMILHCIYSRSSDGFVRQQHLQSLLLMDYDNWAIPYIVKLCDEYVLEILEMTYNILKEQDTEKIKNFCLENVHSFCKSYDRMVSYWNEYYRHRYKNFPKYVGWKLFRECFGYSKSIERRK